MGSKITSGISLQEWLESGHWASVSSSNVAAIAYDQKKKYLFVQFLSGSTYVYYACLPLVAEELFKAPSIGKFLARRIKNLHVYKRLK